MHDPSERLDLDDVYGILKTIGLQRFYNTFVAAGDAITLRIKAPGLLKSPTDHDLLNAYFHLRDRVDAENTTREATLALLHETVMKIQFLQKTKGGDYVQLRGRA